MHRLLNIMPLSRWLQTYQTQHFVSDLIAGIIVAIILVPQSMAYAMLAGMPAEYGLYGAMLPLTLYALLGSSRNLSVGPTAIMSLMVATSVGELNPESSTQYIEYAINLALLAGLFLFLLCLLRLGDIINFISHPVISGFTSAAALLIIASQLPHIIGVEQAQKDEFIYVLVELWHSLENTLPITLMLGLVALVVLWFFLKPLPSLLRRSCLPVTAQQTLSKTGSMFVVVLSTLAVALFDLEQVHQVKTVGAVLEGLPLLSGIAVNFELWSRLALPAVLIALVCFLESTSIGTGLASKRHERIVPNQELLALGAANLGAAFSGSFAVAGSFSRSAINFNAGAQTTIASLISAVLVCITLLYLTPWFYYLPKAALGAIVIVAALPMIDVSSFRRCWNFNKVDGLTMLTTFSMVLALGVERGILFGIACSMLLLIYRSSRPHIAVLGRAGESRDFRNIKRQNVSTQNNILVVRVDENLYFANTRYVEAYILQHCAPNSELRHLVLSCIAVNFIDASALETLEGLIIKLRNMGITLNLTEIKGPVMDRLNKTPLFDHLLPGRVFSTTDDAMGALASVSPH